MKQEKNGYELKFRGILVFLKDAFILKKNHDKKECGEQLTHSFKQKEEKRKKRENLVIIFFMFFLFDYTLSQFSNK